MLILCFKQTLKGSYCVLGRGTTAIVNVNSGFDVNSRRDFKINMYMYS